MGYSLPFVITVVTNPGSTTSTSSTVAAGTYTRSNGGSDSSDVVYESKSVILSIQGSFTGLVDFEFSCSQSGATSISAAITADLVTGTFPSWVAVHSGMNHLSVSTPAYSQSNTYYFIVQETVGAVTNDRSVILHVLGCNIEN